MIRPFHLRDMALVRRLGERGILLQTQIALTTVPHPVRHAIFHMLIGGRYSTFVWKSENRDAAGFVQLCCQNGNSSARIVCLGVERHDSEENEDLEISEELWIPMLEEAISEAGRHGIHNLVAEAPEDGLELPLLRKAGFVVYTRQDIYINDQEIHGQGQELLRLKQSVDDWNISVLYSNTVPGLIQSVEPTPPLDEGDNWVLHEGDELAAFVHIMDGPVASWMQLLIHPNASTRPRLIIAAALQQKSSSAQHPIYCRVRRYQSWLQVSLEKAGFRYWGSQAVLVKHIVQQVKPREPVTQTVLEPQTVPGSPPLIHGFEQSNGNNNT